MALNENIAAYEDCIPIWDRALADPKGARACLGSYDEAYRYSMRMQMCRRLFRDESRRAWPKGDPGYNKSPWDGLKVTKREDTEGTWWVYITPHGQEIIAVEGLSEEQEPT